MKLFGAVVVMVAATDAWASDGARQTRRVVTACLNPGTNVIMMYRGQAIATQILGQAGVRLDWRSDERACAGGNGLVVSVSPETPVGFRQGRGPAVPGLGLAPLLQRTRGQGSKDRSHLPGSTENCESRGGGSVRPPRAVPPPCDSRWAEHSPPRTTTRQHSEAA